MALDVQRMVVVSTLNYVIRRMVKSVDYRLMKALWNKGHLVIRCAECGRTLPLGDREEAVKCCDYCHSDKAEFIDLTPTKDKNKEMLDVIREYINRNNGTE